tara:strand:+ start:131 stop:1228 length:1098 start_codon:yes stop_codon:yes gene_type:complete
MSILSVDQIQPIGSGTTITLNATEVKTGTEITVGTGASIFSPAGNTLTFGTNNVERLRITNDGTFTVQTGGSERLRIASNGRIGVGNNNPQFMIHTEGSGNNGGVRIENSHTTTTVSGNTASGAFPHNLLLSNYSGTGSADNRMCSIGFDIPTTSTHANAVIAYQATAAGTGDLQFHLESGNSISERLRIKSDGDVSINDGNLIVASGHGIDFSARSGSNAGATSSVLDDYEEGVYQPTITGSSGGSHNLVSYTHLAYTKIGRLVHIQGYININGGSLSGNLKLSLPFTVSNDAAGHSRYSAIGLSWRGHGWSGNTGEITFAVQPNTTYGEFVSVSPNGNHTWITNTHVNNSYNIRIGGSYITNT